MDKRGLRLKVLPAVLVAAIVAMIILVLGVVATYVYLISWADDPFRPRPPEYQYEAAVTGLDGLAAGPGQATVRLPVPAVNGVPLLTEGWWVNYNPDFRVKRHGTVSLAPENTTAGPMLAARIVPTHYYLSEVPAMPSAISPGQDEQLPFQVPQERIAKPPSFDDVFVIASGSVELLDYPTSAKGKEAVISFLDQPLLPSGENSPGPGNYTTYVYLDPALAPLKNESSIRLTASLHVKLNHNKVNASEEGARRFEYHTYLINETIPGGVRGMVPVKVHHYYGTGLNNPNPKA